MTSDVRTVYTVTANVGYISGNSLCVNSTAAIGSITVTVSFPTYPTNVTASFTGTSHRHTVS